MYSNSESVSQQCDRAACQDNKLRVKPPLIPPRNIWGNPLYSILKHKHSNTRGQGRGITCTSSWAWCILGITLRCTHSIIFFGGNWHHEANSFYCCNIATEVSIYFYWTQHTGHSILATYQVHSHAVTATSIITATDSSLLYLRTVIRCNICKHQRSAVTSINTHCSKISGTLQRARPRLWCSVTLCTMIYLEPPVCPSVSQS